MQGAALGCRHIIRHYKRTAMRKLPAPLYFGFVALAGITIAVTMRPSDLPNIPPSNILRTVAAPDGACGQVVRHSVLGSVDAETLKRLYENIGYDLDAVREGTASVPAVLLSDLPDDLGAMSPVEARKALFIKAVLPAVLFVNDRISEQRRFVERVRSRLERDGGAPTKPELAHLKRLAECYQTKPGDLDVLLRRIDIVPPSLAVAQAAVESAWGTSRFAKDGNAIMGQHGTGADTMKPDGLNDANFGVRAFGHMLGSIGAYAHNLNTHRAYRGFRNARQHLREAGDIVDGRHLVAALTRYSERGKKYVDEVREVIADNRLASLDEARLEPVRPARLAEAAGT